MFNIFNIFDEFALRNRGDSLAFHAMFPDGAGIMQPQLRGIGTAIHTHAATIYAEDVDDVYQLYSTNKTLWVGGRYIDEDTVSARDVGGTPFATVPKRKVQPAGTNTQQYSNDQTNAYYVSANITVTKDQDGLEGTPNYACLLDDSEGAATGYVRKVFAIIADTEIHTVKWWVEKDSDETRFPAILCGSVSDGNWFRTQLNTVTGTITTGTSGGSPTFSREVIDVGNWWVVAIEYTNANYTNFEIWQEPANGVVWGVESAAATGSIIVGNIELHKNKTLSDVRALGPIFTAGAEVSTDATVYAYDGLNVPGTEGAIYLEYQPEYGAAEVSGDIEILSTTAGASLLYLDATANQLESTDGTNTATKSLTVVTGTVYQLGIYWGGGKLRVCVDGGWGTEASYDGAFAGADLHLMRSAANAANLGNLRGFSSGGTAGKAAVDRLMP